MPVPGPRGRRDARPGRDGARQVEPQGHVAHEAPPAAARDEEDAQRRTRPAARGGAAPADHRGYDDAFRGRRRRRIWTRRGGGRRPGRIRRVRRRRPRGRAELLAAARVEVAHAERRSWGRRRRRHGCGRGGGFVRASAEEAPRHGAAAGARADLDATAPPRERVALVRHGHGEPPAEASRVAGVAGAGAQGARGASEPPPVRPVVARRPRRLAPPPPREPGRLLRGGRPRRLAGPRGGGVVGAGRPGRLDLRVAPPVALVGAAADHHSFRREVLPHMLLLAIAHAWGPKRLPHVVGACAKCKLVEINTLSGTGFFVMIDEFVTE